MKEPSSSPANFSIFEEDLDAEWENLFRQAKTLALDTEAMGLFHGRDRLCLVQICDPNDNVACVRIKKGQTSSPRLQKILETKSIEKIMHFARFDVAALEEGLNIQVNPIFCTKIASRLARTYSPRHGLKEVIMELVGVELDKQAQSSDWGRVQQLNEKQLEYAANDTRYLIPARMRLEEMLRREGRWEIAQKCFQCVPIIATLDRMHFNHVFEH